MNYYDYKEIAAAGDCVRFATEVLGCTVKNGRCAATWRGGTRDDSVSLTKEQWKDFASGQGGGLTELCAVAKFNGDTMAAQEFLGQWLNLTPKKLSKRPKEDGVWLNRYDSLIADGYTETARYSYTDAQGVEQYFVVRLEHETKHKQFLQGTKEGWGIKDVKPLLYHLPEVIAADCVFIVEGEKDVETLRSLSLTATTNSSGASKWHDEFNDVFNGKRVIIIADNDEAGQKHGITVANALYGKASTIQVLTVSALPKGDVTDYLTKEGGTYDGLMAKIASAPQFDPVADPVSTAKALNQTSFSNVLIEKTERGGVKETPRETNEMIAELRQRMLGAPFAVGETLFDKDHDTGEIYYIYDASCLFSWIQRKTKHSVNWSKINGAATKQEFFESLKATAINYDSISFTPDYPKRERVFYTHPALPEPDEEHRYFWDFVNFFNPADEVNRALLAAYIMAPIYYAKGSPNRPLWIIDSCDGQGSGKSAIPELVARLYAKNEKEGHPIDASLRELEMDLQELTKRLISPVGRSARILRFDNAVGTVRSSTLARLITSSSISGRAAYGRDEEFRPNNLTYTITANGCTVDTDIASRAFYIMIVKPPKVDAGWSARVFDYVEKNQLHIFADIIDIIKNHEFFDTPPVTRSADFEQRILQPACQTEELYKRVIAELAAKKESTNVDEEIAARIVEEIRARLVDVPPAMGKAAINPQSDSNIFIRSAVLEEWFKGKSWLNGCSIHEKIKELARTGKMPEVSSTITLFPHHKTVIARRRGTMFNYNKNCSDFRVIGYHGKDQIAEIVES